MSDATQRQSVAVPGEAPAVSPKPAIGRPGRDIAQFEDVPVELVMELARTEVTVRDLLALAPGSLLALPAVSFDGVTVMVGELGIARGEISSQDQRYGVRMLEIFDGTEPQGDRS